MSKINVFGFEFLFLVCVSRPVFSPFHIRCGRSWVSTCSEYGAAFGCDGISAHIPVEYRDRNGKMTGMLSIYTMYVLYIRV